MPYNKQVRACLLCHLFPVACSFTCLNISLEKRKSLSVLLSVFRILLLLPSQQSLPSARNRMLSPMFITEFMSWVLTIVVIPNSVDTTVHYPEYRPSAEWYEKWHADFPELKGKYVICLPARVTRHKGAAHLAPILVELKKRGIPAHAVILGEVKKDKMAFKEELVSLFEKEGLSGDVTWTGLRRDVRDIMVACDVIVSLNLLPEAFGKTTLEALALGRPTAGYEAGGVGEQLDDYLPEGKVPTGDTTAMANVLANWYKNPPTPKMPLQAPYRRKDMTDAYIALYREVCKC